MANKVLLGFADEPIIDNYADKTDYTTNKFGGFPVSHFFFQIKAVLKLYLSSTNKT